jgi:hypothetical protein
MAEALAAMLPYEDTDVDGIVTLETSVISAGSSRVVRHHSPLTLTLGNRHQTHPDDTRYRDKPRL